MFPAQRRQAIIRAVRAGSAQVGDLAQELGVSEMTVRRDLRVLAEEGRLERVRGGAVSAERPFEQIADERTDAKDRIGRAAAALVEDGQTVMLDIGTTALHVAMHLRGRRLTVITTNLAAYEVLERDEGIELVLPGGTVRRNYLSLVGVLAETGLRQLRADIAFISCSAVLDGSEVWDTTMVEVPIKRAMLEAGERTVLLADHEKFDGAGLIQVCPVDALDTIVTDAAVPATARKGLEQAGVEVVIG